MTVSNIIPCVCAPHPPSVDDTSEFAMPVLLPCNSFKEHQQLWKVKCLKCGRMGIKQYKSPYLALKAWNETMVSLYAFEHRVIIYKEDFENTCKRLYE